MKMRISILSILVVCLFQISGAQEPVVAPDNASYTNPLPVSLGDPFLLYENGTYYLYGTGAETGFPAYKSGDLRNWQSIGQVYTRDSLTSWGMNAFWAPEVYKVKNKYYLFYSAQWKNNPTNELENFRIGIAVADQPGGPFIDFSDKPVFDPGYPIIDADVFFRQGWTRVFVLFPVLLQTCRQQ